MTSPKTPVVISGFAMLSGDPGTGKSVALRQLQARLDAVLETKVAQYTRPQNNVCDFYRELGHHFGVDMTFSNRFRGFKGLRECWLEHNRAAMFKPVLLVDEEQEIPSSVLSELRLLTSMNFDSKNLLAVEVLLFGNEKLRSLFLKSTSSGRNPHATNQLSHSEKNLLQLSQDIWSSSGSLGEAIHTFDTSNIRKLQKAIAIMRPDAL